ncbi:expressed unknown protein [Seminavis robusta]|uniref:Uncharacterized protein n=1 Tax=Seminavis robusta TaxID=568900 RepID=A0A9N8DL40_9STRA|nr:expressed unknown protein [Seminavis robusta]|eukprot:Sro217_g089770.1 n/a (140) ;mRNA; f:56785-57204
MRMIGLTKPNESTLTVYRLLGRFCGIAVLGCWMWWLLGRKDVILLVWAFTAVCSICSLMLFLMFVAGALEDILLLTWVHPDKAVDWVVVGRYAQETPLGVLSSWMGTILHRGRDWCHKMEGEYFYTEDEFIHEAMDIDN